MKFLKQYYALVALLLYDILLNGLYLVSIDNKAQPSQHFDDGEKSEKNQIHLVNFDLSSFRSIK